MDTEQNDALTRRLDALLSLRLGQRMGVSATSIGVDTRNSVEMEHELQPLLTVAGRFDALRDARPDDAYVNALEARLLRYAQSIQPLHAPTVSIGGLGSEGMALAEHDAPTLPISGVPPAPGDGYGQATPHWPMPQRVSPQRVSPQRVSPQRVSPQRVSPQGATRTGVRRLPGVAWAALAAAVLLTCTFSLFTVAASAAPGSALYGLRRLEQTIQSQLTTDPAARVRLHLANATDALNALGLAAAHHDSAAYDAAFTTLQSEDAAAQSGLALVTSEAEHTSLQGQLDALHASERQNLSADLPLLAWSERVRTTTALGALGVAAPVVASAQITPPGVTLISGHGDGSGGSSDGSGSGEGGNAGSRSSDSHGWMVTLHGAGFVAGAQLMVDGQPLGQTLSITPTLLIATVAIQDAGALNRASSIGILAPNSEAAETSTITRSASATPQTPTSTPTPLPTSTPPGGDHRHGKGGH